MTKVALVGDESHGHDSLMGGCQSRGSRSRRLRLLRHSQTGSTSPGGSVSADETLDSDTHPMKTISAEQWNRHYPVGTPVRVVLVDGSTFVARTDSNARQWGMLAILSLAGRVGYWTTEALEPLDLLPADPVSTIGDELSIRATAGVSP